MLQGGFQSARRASEPARLPEPTRMTTLRSPLSACKWLLPSWGIAVLAGFAWLQLYAATPQTQGRAPLNWPASSVPRSGNGSTLLVFIHPYCPCSRATLEELAAIMSRCHGRLEALVLFVIPASERAAWERHEYWRAASAIPGVRAMLDRDGVEASKFGARTSGQTILFDQAGARRFAGGITASRGHAGDNEGQNAVVAWVNAGRAETSATPTFGCTLPPPPERVNGASP